MTEAAESKTSDTQMTRRNFWVLGFLVCSEIESRGGLQQQRKILFVEKRSERLHGGMHQDLENGGPMSQVGNWVFIAFFIA
jgi:hypothetical protein